MDTSVIQASLLGISVAKGLQPTPVLPTGLLLPGHWCRVPGVATLWLFRRAEPEWLQ